MQCFPQFLLEDPFWLLKITKNPHILTHINTECLDDLYPILKTNISELTLANHKFIPVAYVRSGYGGLGVSTLDLVPKYAGSNLAEAVGFFRAKKILSAPSFGRAVKPWVPCR
jgi:hypothetical protein